MILKREDLTLYGVTDRRWHPEKKLVEQVEEALKGGITMLQLREKNLSQDEFIAEAVSVKKICQEYGVPLLINDNVEVAVAADADGVHLGQGDMSPKEARKILGADKIIGVTAKTVEQAVTAEKNGADYLGSGAVFGTDTKADARPLSHDALDEICENVSIPVVAIGGINIDNIRMLKGRKNAGFAIVSGIFAAQDIEAMTGRILETIKEMRQEETQHL